MLGKIKSQFSRFASIFSKQNPADPSTEEVKLTDVNYRLIDVQPDTVIDELGRTELHIAAEKGNLVAVKILLQNGHDGTIPDNSGKTPLHYAAAKGHNKVATYLLDYNSDFDTSDHIFRTPLHVDVQVSDCIFAKSEYLNSKLVAFVNAKDNDGKSPIRYALDNQKFGTVGTLIEHGSRFPEQMAGFKLLPLFVGYYNNPSLWFLLINYPRLIAEVDIGSLFHLPLVEKNYHTKVMDSIFTNAQLGLNVSRFVYDLSRQINTSSELTDIDHLKCLEYLMTICAEEVSVNDSLISASRQGHIETYKYFIKQPHYRCERHVKATIASNSTNILEHLWENHHLCPDYTDRNTILHVVFAAGSWQAVEYLVQKGTNVNAIDTEGRSPLHYAYAYPQDDLVKYLIAHGADVNVVDHAGRTALDYILIPLPPLPDRCTTPYPPKNHLMKYLVTECNARLGSICKDAIFRWIYLDGDVNRKNSGGKSPLHLATELESKSLMKHLIENGADVDVRDSKGKTPLHYCAKMCNWRSIVTTKCLLKRGAMYDVKDHDNKTAEDYFTQVKGKEFEITNRLRRTRKLFACVADPDKWKVVRVGDYLDKKTRGSTMTITNNVSLDAADRQGNTLLHLAADADNSHLEGARSWSDRSNDAKERFRNNRRNNNGDTPLHLAAAKGHYSMVTSFIGGGNYFNTRNNEGYTPEQLAVRNGHDKVAQRLQRVNSLFVAAKNNDEKGLQDGLAYRWDAKFKDDEGKTLLHWAAIHGHIRIAEFLWDRRCDVMAIDNDGCTALHLAASNGHLPMVKFLLGHYSRFNPINKDGKTPLDMAKGEPARLLGAITDCFQGQLDNPNAILDTLKSILDNDKETFSYIIRAMSRDRYRGNHQSRFIDKEGFLELGKFLLISAADFRGGYGIMQCVVHICENQDLIDLLKFLNRLFQWQDQSVYSLQEVAKDPMRRAILQGVRDLRGCTMFHNAFSESRINYYRLNYLHQIGVDINARDHNGGTALQLAIEFKKFDFIRFLLEKKASLTGINDTQKEELFLEAAKAGRHDVIKSFKLLQDEQMQE